MPEVPKMRRKIIRFWAVFYMKGMGFSMLNHHFVRFQTILANQMPIARVKYIYIYTIKKQSLLFWYWHLKTVDFKEQLPRQRVLNVIKLREIKELAKPYSKFISGQDSFRFHIRIAAPDPPLTRLKNGSACCPLHMCLWFLNFKGTTAWATVKGCDSPNSVSTLKGSYGKSKGRG